MRVHDERTFFRIQHTLTQPVEFDGVGLHTGVQTRIRISPAVPNAGIVFRRTDLPGSPVIPATYRYVTSTELATTVGNDGATVATVEHLMSALYCSGITNAIVDVDGPEIPILDGSASPFFRGLSGAGILPQAYTRSILKILKPIKVYSNEAVCELLPRENFRLTTSIDFAHPMIGVQTYALEVSANSFATEIASARTFGFFSDLERLRQANRALGASLESVLALTGDGVMNEEGMRFPDECVRHKLLDALGDLALFGAWIQGEMVSFRGGHSIHLTLLKELSKYPHSWELLEPEPLMSDLRRVSPLSNEATLRNCEAKR